MHKFSCLPPGQATTPLEVDTYKTTSCASLSGQRRQPQATAQTANTGPNQAWRGAKISANSAQEAPLIGTLHLQFPRKGRPSRSPRRLCLLLLRSSFPHLMVKSLLLATPSAVSVVLPRVRHSKQAILDKAPYALLSTSAYQDRVWLNAKEAAHSTGLRLYRIGIICSIPNSSEKLEELPYLVNTNHQTKNNLPLNASEISAETV